MSGGTKGLGLQYARDAAAAGQQCLVLSSRQPSLPQGELAALAASGAAVFVVRCSSADSARSAQVAGWVRERLPRAAVYAHAAGAPGHDTLADVTPDVWHCVVRPKVIRCSDISYWLPYRAFACTAIEIHYISSRPYLLHLISVCIRVICMFSPEQCRALIQTFGCRFLEQQHSQYRRWRLLTQHFSRPPRRCGARLELRTTRRAMLSWTPVLPLLVPLGCLPHLSISDLSGSRLT